MHVFVSTLVVFLDNGADVHQSVAKQLAACEVFHASFVGTLIRLRGRGTIRFLPYWASQGSTL